jgi:phosphoribosylformylglycinamidine synthase
VFDLGKTEGYLDQSIFAKDILSEKKGPPPNINLFNEKNIGETVLKLIDQNLIDSCHDVSLGGILIAIAKMCIKGRKGIKINPFKELINKFEYFFGEDQGRYVIELSKSNIEKTKLILEKNSVHYDEIGIIIKYYLRFINNSNFIIMHRIFF